MVSATAVLKNSSSTISPRCTCSALRAQAMHLAVDDAVVDREHLARALDQAVDAARTIVCASDLAAAAAR